MKRDLKFVRDLIGETKQKRDALVEKQENGTVLTAEEIAQFDTYQSDLEGLLGEEKRLLVLNESRSQSPVTGLTGNRDFSAKDEKDLSSFSLLRGLATLAQGKALTGVEKEVNDIAHEEARSKGIILEGFGVPSFSLKRGQTVTGQTSAAGDQGGVAVPTEVNDLIEALWSKNFLSQLGATRLSGLKGNQKFPVQSTKAAVQERTEIEALEATEILFDDVDMTPNRRGIYIPISKQALLQMSFDVQQFVQDQIRKGFDYKLNLDTYTALAAAVVSGNSNLLAVGTNGGAPTYAHIVGMESQVANLDADQGDLAYLVNSKTRGKLKLTEKFSGTNGNPVWEPQNTLNGYKTVVSNIIPSNLTKGTASGVCSAAFFGNFADIYVGMWGGMDFIVDPYTLAGSGQIKLVANMFWDVEIARTASFTGYKDFTTT